MYVKSNTVLDLVTDSQNLYSNGFKTSSVLNLDKIRRKINFLM